MGGELVMSGKGGTGFGMHLRGVGRILTLIASAELGGYL